MNIKAQVKAAVIDLQGPEISHPTFDKAWAKYGREAANYGQSAAERVAETGGPAEAAETVLGFYNETLAAEYGRLTGPTYNQARARRYGKSVTFNVSKGA